MSRSPTFAQIRAELSVAKTRVRQLTNEENRFLVQVSCTLCKAEPGQPCIKGGVYHQGRAMGVRRGPHAERKKAIAKNEV